MSFRAKTDQQTNPDPGSTHQAGSTWPWHGVTCFHRMQCVETTSNVLFPRQWETRGTTSSPRNHLEEEPRRHSVSIQNIETAAESFNQSISSTFSRSITLRFKNKSSSLTVWTQFRIWSADFQPFSTHFCRLAVRPAPLHTSSSAHFLLRHFPRTVADVALN